MLAGRQPSSRYSGRHSLRVEGNRAGPQGSSSSPMYVHWHGYPLHTCTQLHRHTYTKMHTQACIHTYAYTTHVRVYTMCVHTCLHIYTCTHLPHTQKKSLFLKKKKGGKERTLALVGFVLAGNVRLNCK